MTAKCLMIQGTTSDAGKSAIATGLCRILRRSGLTVAPFKPQNMALNSAVTVDGGEIGRAQAVQALACGLEAHSDMNPVLLKPSGEKVSQVIVCGHARREMTASEFHAYKSEIFPDVLQAYDRLASRVDVVIIEGAGSPAEINLRHNDIANMGFAQAIQSPVVLVADIERGGVFAQIVGTLELLNPLERDLLQGIIINRFRGDVEILRPGLDWVERRTERPVLGVMPYLHDLYLQAEDSLAGQLNQCTEQDALRVVVPRLPRLSNQTDFDPLLLHPQVDLCFVDAGEAIPAADLVIIPGSKNVRSDLGWLRENNWQSYLDKHLRYGGKLLGICGGYQMLGNVIDDPLGIEGQPGSSPGFGLLDVETCLTPAKRLTYVEGRLFIDNAMLRAYEIHAGITTGRQTEYPFAKIGAQFDGAVSNDGQIAATYLHGLFDQTQACRALLAWAGLTTDHVVDVVQRQQLGIDLIADTMQDSVSITKIKRIIGL